MARERYLLHVSEDELRPDPKPEPPKTPKGKLENFWYHYKWHTIGISFAVIVLTVMVVQLVTKDNPDYTVILATNSYVSDAAIEKLSSELEVYGSDVNSDGKVEVSIESLVLGDTSSTYGMAYKTKLIAHFSAGDVMLYIFDKTSYESNVTSQETEGYHFFATLDTQVNGLEGDGRYWNWKNDSLRTDSDLSSLPENLYFGVRDTTGTASKATKMQQQCRELLEAFLNSRS